MNERQGASPDPAHATPLRLVAAERLGRMQHEVAAAAVDLRATEHEPDPGTVVTTSKRIDALQTAVVALAARVQELSATTASFSDLLTARQLDYADQVRRLSLVAEQSLAAHRQALAERDSTVEKLADAVGSISRDLGGILDQVMASLRQSREVSARNDELSEQLVHGFAQASQQLAQQGQELRDALLTVGTPASIVGSNLAADEIHAAIDQLREDLGTDLSGLRRLLNRERTESAAAPAPVAEELDAVRDYITSEMEALVHELHDDQVLMMREILASQKEIKKLRDEIAVGGHGGGEGNGGAQLENEINRLLIELRALRRRPALGGGDDVPAPAPRPAPRPRARLSPTAKAQWAGRPMQGKNRSSR